MRQVIIMRGPSGSGKSTFVKKYFPNALVCSADNFFLERIPGSGRGWVYVFDPKKIGEAHARCLNEYLNALFDPDPEFPTIVVDNTNMQAWEMMNYLLPAFRMNIKVQVFTTMNPLQMSAEELSRTNVHGVPTEIIQSMLDRYEPHSEDIHIDLYARYNPLK